MDACPFCLHHRLRFFARLLSPLDGAQTIYYRCPRCAAVLQRPLAEMHRLERYYESYLAIKDVMNPGYLDESSFRSLSAERDRSFREIGFDVRRIAEGRNVELGCANGLFLRYLTERGSKSTVGIDISASMLSGITLENVRLIQGSLSDLEDASADNLFLFNVLEHIPDIRSACAAVSRVLVPGGYAVIEVPLSGLVSALHGRSWRFLMCDEHLNIPSRRALLQLCRENGLALRGQTRFGSGFTTGMLSPPLKFLADFLAKKASIGDRGCFLMQKTAGKA